MKNFLIVFFIAVYFAACNNDENAPDVSNIKVEVPIERFEKDFFSLDTLDIEKGLRNLEMKYPSLYPIFIHNILGLHDSSRDKGVVRFMTQNRFIAEAADKEFKNANEIKKDFEQAFRYVKYYFPEYRIPKVATIVGPPRCLCQESDWRADNKFFDAGSFGNIDPVLSWQRFFAL